MNKVDAIIQARLSSTRLPGKILKKVVNKTLLEHIIERIKYSKYIDNIIVATTKNKIDNQICQLLNKIGISYYRGSEEDVLERYYQTAIKFGCEYISRVTADNPFVDPKVTDQVIKMFMKEKLDFAYNDKPPTYPEGINAEIFTFKALQKAQKESMDSFEREHVTQYFYRHPELFKQQNMKNNVDLSYLRWTVDTLDDFRMAQEVYRKLYNDKPIFLMNDILKLIEKYPSIAKMNENVKRSYMYNQTK